MVEIVLSFRMSLAYPQTLFFFQEKLHLELYECADLRDCHKNCKGAEEHVVDGQSQPA